MRALSTETVGKCLRDSATYQKSMSASVIMQFPGNLKVEIPENLNCDHPEAFIEWSPQGDPSERLVRGVAWKTPGKLPIFLIFD